MRLSATQAATGALTAAVVAGLLLLPGQLLGTESGDRTVITLPVTTAPAPVHAAPVVAPKPARKPAAKAQPQPVAAAVPVSRLERAAPVVARPSASRPHTTIRSALVDRIVRSQAVRAALNRRSGRPTKHEAPPDPVITAAPAAPAPAPTPAPAPAPASPPAQAPASTPAPTATTPQPTIVASVEQPIAPTGNWLQQALADHPHGDDGGHWRDHGQSPWDGHFGGGDGGHDHHR